MIEGKRKILITSYYYEPEITPRAFRTIELVKEFINRDYIVELYIPELDKRSEYPKKSNCKIYYVKPKKINITKSEFRDKNRLVSKAFNLLKKGLRYFVGEIKPFFYGYQLYKKLRINASNDYDLIISIGLPFYVHLATALFITKTSQRGVKVCDYGDPFYYNPVSKNIFYLKYIEKWVVKKFDYISIPTIKSLKYFTEYKDKNHIKVIPQGFDFTKITIDKYTPNDIPNFCYAGFFYEKIRNPTFFLNFLESLNTDYKFTIYTDRNTGFNRDICLRFKKKLGNKIIIKDYIPREELIKELSKMDFLINFENFNSNQVPSKIIDYTLSKRPIMSLNQDAFNEIIFMQFLNRDYRNALKISIEDYDIKNVVTKFERLSTS
jgi:hypothetical protein